MGFVAYAKSLKNNRKHKDQIFDPCATACISQSLHELSRLRRGGKN